MTRLNLESFILDHIDYAFLEHLNAKVRFNHAYNLKAQVVYQKQTPIKTVYLDGPKGRVGIVTELDKKVKQKDLAAILDISVRQAKSLKMSVELPRYQTRGTCSPLMNVNDYFQTDMIIFDDKDLGEVEFQMPGTPKLNMHVEYETLFNFFDTHFPDKYHWADLK